MIKSQHHLDSHNTNLNDCHYYILQHQTQPYDLSYFLTQSKIAAF